MLESEIKGKAKVLYAKGLPVVQSSGTGKSRVLTEVCLDFVLVCYFVQKLYQVGKHIFTLLICLSKQGDPGYPPGDPKVVEYFNALSKTNDLSYSTHIAVASFLAAAHTTMLLWLKRAQDENNLHGQDLLNYWHGIMEPTEEREERNKFYEEVVCKANKAS